MELLRNKSAMTPQGQLEGRFLVAMPGMDTDYFSNSIVYVCAHNADGAMGFIVNKPATMSVGELMTHTGIPFRDNRDKTGMARSLGPIRAGGPVDEHRGFVLHSDDYCAGSTIPISEHVFLTSTLQILKSIASGTGPRRAAVALGYAGWGAGQLEREIRDNCWLTFDGDPEVVFDHNNDAKYDALIARMGIGRANFIAEAGHA